MTKIEIKNLFKKYPLDNKEKFTALSNINLSFHQGELVAIVGESGSGKSTLMNLIGGLDSKFEGDLIVDGLNLRNLPDKQLDKYRKNKVGFVFQSFNLISHLSVLDNVCSALTLSNVPEKIKTKKALELLTKLGIEKYAKRKPTQLSGGQKQRVAIARALINDPDIILADEPTGSLDSKTTQQILEILKQIADDGKLVIMVTHSEKVSSVCSRVIEIFDGQIVSDTKNKNYKKNRKKKNNNEHFKAEKQHLSLKSALKLAFHNMWTNKIKNILMAFGVAISISSMILMLSFGSGLTDYVTNVASDYTNPLVVPVSKKSDNMISSLSSYWTEEEISSLTEELNSFLSKNNEEFTISDENLKRGFTMINLTGNLASIDYSVDNEIKTQSLFCLYTTPPTYNETNLIEGNFSGENEVMFNSYIYNLLGDEVVGKQVDIYVNIAGIEVKKTVDISGVVNTSTFDGILCVYVDYDFLEKCVIEQNKSLTPTDIYIITENENQTILLKNYIKTSDKYSGSMEERLADMFSEMSNTISIALAVIAGISLIVSAIMILTVLYMSVSERTKEIGVLKAIGARRRDIKNIFVSESFLIGLLSAVVGICLSLISFGIFSILFNALLGFVPLSLRWYYFVIAILLSVLISMLSGLYPSSKASKMDPVESLRRE